MNTTNRKQKFLEAIQLLAPDNRFIFQVAQLVREEDLPSVVGLAALELAATLEMMQIHWRRRQEGRGASERRSVGA